MSFGRKFKMGLFAALGIMSLAIIAGIVALALTLVQDTTEDTPIGIVGETAGAAAGSVSAVGETASRAAGSGAGGRRLRAVQARLHLSVPKFGVGSRRMVHRHGRGYLRRRLPRGYGFYDAMVHPSVCYDRQRCDAEQRHQREQLLLPGPGEQSVWRLRLADLLQGAALHSNATQTYRGIRRRRCGQLPRCGASPRA